MPLEKSPTDAARNRNISQEIESGRPRDQAIAIGYSEQRAARKDANAAKKRALAKMSGDVNE